MLGRGCFCGNIRRRGGVVVVICGLVGRESFEVGTRLRSASFAVEGAATTLKVDASLHYSITYYYSITY
jgi:hypothetical protein